MCYTAHGCHQSVQEAPWVCRRQIGGISGQVEERPRRKVLISGVQRSSVMKFQTSVGGGENSAGLVKAEKIYFQASLLPLVNVNLSALQGCM